MSITLEFLWQKRKNQTWLEFHGSCHSVQILSSWNTNYGLMDGQTRASLHPHICLWGWVIRRRIGIIWSYTLMTIDNSLEKKKQHSYLYPGIHSDPSEQWRCSCPWQGNRLNVSIVLFHKDISYPQCQLMLTSTISWRTVCLTICLYCLSINILQLTSHHQGIYANYGIFFSKLLSQPTDPLYNDMK